MLYKDKSRLEISKSALLHNLRLFRNVVGRKTKVAAVVKANAYGHGLTGVVSLLGKKVDIFCVDNVDEAIEVRAIDADSTIIVLGYTTFANLKRAVENEISITVYNPETLKKIVVLKSVKKAKVHIKV